MAEFTTDLEPKPAPAEKIETQKPASAQKRHIEKQLDHGLDETFPASDPVSINPGSD